MPRTSTSTSTLRPMPTSETTELFVAGGRLSSAKKTRTKKTKGNRPRRRRRAIKISDTDLFSHSVSFSDSDDNNDHTNKRFRPIAMAPPPMPPVNSPGLFPDDDEMMMLRGRTELDNTPQVLLWKSTSWTSQSSANNNSNSNSNNNSPRSHQDKEDEEKLPEEQRSSPPNIVRTQGVQRQGPSPPSANQDAEEQEPLDLTVGPQGPKWYELQYWRQKLTTNCCLPQPTARRPTSSGTSNRQNNGRYQNRRQINYRPAYLNGHLGLPYHSFVQAVPMHQLSPMTDNTLMQGYYRPQYQHHQPHQQKQPWQYNRSHKQPSSYYHVPPPSLVQQQQQHHVTPLVANDNRHWEQHDINQSYNHNDNAQAQSFKPSRGHARSYSSLSAGNITPPPGRDSRRRCRDDDDDDDDESPDRNDYVYPPVQDSPVPDYQSISSLEPGSPWRTPTQQEPKLHIPPDTQPTMVTPSVANDANTPSNNRVDVIGLRRRANTGDSPRTTNMPPSSTNSSKPPVAPRRRTQSASGQKTTPRLQQQQSSPTNNITSRPRDLDRCFSEASNTTTGSRHRRGGTVTEFSFESITNGPNFQNNIPKPSGTARSISLPLEVQVVHHGHHHQHHHHQRPPRPNHHVPQVWSGEGYEDWEEEEADYDHPIIPQLSESLSSCHVVLSPQSTIGNDEDVGGGGGNPPADGYISPLEEEERQQLVYAHNQYCNTNNNGENNSQTNSPSGTTTTTDRRSPTEDTVDFVTGSPRSMEQSNPQDSLRYEKENVPEEKKEEDDDDDDVGACDGSPFGKLKEPPAIPSGDSWMWKWVNHNHGLPAVQEDEAAATITNINKTIMVYDEIEDGSVIMKQAKSPRKKPVQEYLPKCTALEQQWEKQEGSEWDKGTALTGWVAFGLGDSLIQKLCTHDKPLAREDIAYLVAPNESQTLWVTQPDGTFTAVDLKRCRCEVKEVSRRHGRAVVVTSNSTATVVCTLLPVSLPSHYAGTDEEFALARPFPKGDYLPDDQQYTTMHIMFSLDALVKANGSWG